MLLKIIEKAFREAKEEVIEEFEGQSDLYAEYQAQQIRSLQEIAAHGQKIEAAARNLVKIMGVMSDSGPVFTVSKQQCDEDILALRHAIVGLQATLSGETVPEWALRKENLH